MEERQSLITFPNKMKLILSGRDTRAVAITVSISNGYENESVRQNGISNVIERLLYSDLSTQAARYGAELSTQVTAEHIGIRVSVVRENLSKILIAISRAIFDFNPKLEEFSAVKNKVIRRLELLKTNPTNILEGLTRKNLYPKAGLSNNPGKISSVNKLSLSETKTYMKKILGPSTLTISVVGDIFDKKPAATANENTIFTDSRYKEVYALIMEHFYGKLISYKDSKPKYSEYTQINAPVYKQKSKILNQDRFEISFPAVPYSAVSYKYVNLLTNYIAGYLKQRLANARNIYGLDARNFAFRNNGYIRVQFAVDSEDATVVYENMINLLKNIKLQGISNSEMESLKKSYIARVVFEHETMLSLAKRYTKWMSLKDILFDLDEEIDSIRDLKYSTFQQVANEILDFGRVSVAHVGRKRENFDPLKILRK